MKLSIVMPVLDEAVGVESALSALAPLRARGHEVIVVDGGSRDATPVRAAPHADRVLLAPRGRSTQMNVGAAVAQGDALVFLHADCRLPERADTAIAGALASRHRWGRFDVVLAGRSKSLAVVAHAMNVRSRLTGIATGDQAIFVERAAFEAAGGFAPIPLMEDVALSATLKRLRGSPASLTERVEVSGRRWDQGGVVPTIVAMWALRFAYWRGTDPARLCRRYYGRSPPARPVLKIFAKPIVPGRVKTRLAAVVGNDAATAAYSALVRKTLDTAIATRRAGVVSEVELWIDVAGAQDDAGRLGQWAASAGIATFAQQGSDLGARMQHALRDSLAKARTALLIGTDVPGYDVAYLAQAAAALEAGDTVIGPAEDGGYVLIGLARDLDLFDAMPWSSPGLIEATRSRLQALAVPWRELPLLWDVDTSVDLARFEATLR